MKYSRFYLFMIALTIILMLCYDLSKYAYAYSRGEHDKITQLAFSILHDLYPGVYYHIQRYPIDGNCPEIRTMVCIGGRDEPPPDTTIDVIMGYAALMPDFFKDLEFVDVEGDRDDPHWEEYGAIDDRARYSADDDWRLRELLGRHDVFTSYNHFIDIGSYGSSRFDDYDGYHCARIWNSVYNSGPCYEILWETICPKVDQALGFYFNDEYVHAYGPWYENCSPSVWRYSFPGHNLTEYPTVEDELRARFPLANSKYTENMGIIHSVFMPVDNMAKFWYYRFLATLDHYCLGPVLHAIQDCSIPHHTAGVMGNWHSIYEEGGPIEEGGMIGNYVEIVRNSTVEINKIKDLVLSWDRIDSNVPTSLAPDDYVKTPAINWDIEELATWGALHAYQQYLKFYTGPLWDGDDPKFILYVEAIELVRFATAMSVLVVKKAVQEGAPFQYLIEHTPPGDIVFVDRGVHIIASDILDFNGSSCTVRSSDGTPTTFIPENQWPLTITNSGVSTGTIEAGRNSTITIGQ